jgi:hypothetical protein
MSRFRRLKQSDRIVPGTAICCDCGLDTMPRPSRPRTYEQFVVTDEVWSAAGMTPGTIRDNVLVGGGFLCVGCIEVRLGRRLTIADFKPITIPLLLSDPWCSERLRSRALYPTQAAEDAAKLAPPTKWQTELTEDGVTLTVTLEPPETETSFGWHEAEECVP